MRTYLTLFFKKQPHFRLGFVFISLFLVVVLGQSVYSLWKKTGIVYEREAVRKRLEYEHAQLEDKLREASSPAFIEREARNTLGWVREGDIVILTNKDSQQESPQRTENIALWKQWWRLFF